MGKGAVRLPKILVLACECRLTGQIGWAGERGRCIPACTRQHSPTYLSMNTSVFHIKKREGARRIPACEKIVCTPFFGSDRKRVQSPIVS